MRLRLFCGTQDGKQKLIGVNPDAVSSIEPRGEKRTAIWLIGESDRPWIVDATFESVFETLGGGEDHGTHES